jgi:hypothetical protein
VNQTEELDESLDDVDLEAVMKAPIEAPAGPAKRKRRKYRRYPTPTCTPAQKEALYEYQRGRCGICGQEFPIKDLMVDHSYRVGDNRGLLCRAHNSALGFFKDSPQMLRNALRYLKQPPARQIRLDANKGVGCQGGGKSTRESVAEPESRSRKGPEAKKPGKSRERKGTAA